MALAPGAEAPLIDLDLPAGLTGPAREDVARRMVADRLGGERAAIEARPCIVAGAPQPWTRVIVADAARLAGWRRRLAPHGGRCRGLVPDYLALPGAAGLWVVQAGKDAVTVRTGLDDGFTAEDGLAALMLEKALARGPAPRAVLRTGVAAPGVDAVLAGAGLRLVGEASALSAPGDPRPGVFAHRELWLDLSKDLGAATDRLHRSLLAWRAPVALGLAALALWSGVQWTALTAAEDAARAHRARAEALAREHFVPAGPILDIRAQVTRALDEAARAAAGPADDARPTARLRTAAEVLVARQARLTGVSYQEGSGLALTVEAADFGEIDQLVDAIAARGLAVTLAEASALDDGGVTGVLTLADGARGQ